MTELLQPGLKLERGYEQVGLTAWSKVSGQRSKNASRDPTAVGSAVEGQVLPGVGVPFVDGRGKVGRIREYQVEASHSCGQVGAKNVEGKVLSSGPTKQCAQCGDIEVRRDHEMGTVPCRGEGGEAATASDFEDIVTGARPCEPGQESGIFPLRVDLGDIARTLLGHAGGSAHPCAPNTL